MIIGFGREATSEEIKMQKTIKNISAHLNHIDSVPNRLKFVAEQATNSHLNRTLVIPTLTQIWQIVDLDKDNQTFGWAIVYVGRKDETIVVASLANYLDGEPFVNEGIHTSLSSVVKSFATPSFEFNLCSVVF